MIQRKMTEREETRARTQRKGEGKQGFQINYWSGVRWTFNLTNQLPNYTTAAKMLDLVLFYECVCSWLVLRVQVLL